MDQHKPHGVLTQKTVVERCARMFKHNQWKQLYAFCLEEPRARGWAAQKRKEFPNLTLVDPRVREFFEKVAAMPAAPASSSLPVTVPSPDAAAPSPAAAEAAAAEPPVPPLVTGTPLAPPPVAPPPPVAVVPPPAPDPAVAAMFQPRVVPAPVITEDVDLASMEIRRPTSAAPAPVEEGVSVEFTQDLTAQQVARLPPSVKEALRAGAVLDAAQALLRQLQQTLPGDPPPINALGLEELMAELAQKGKMEVVVNILSKLPLHITAGAMEDLGEKLRLGAVLQEPVQWFADAVKETGDERSQPALQEILMSSIRSAIGEGEG